MIPALKAVAILLAIYGAYGVLTGAIYSKGMVRVVRADSPFTFWLICLSNIGVGTAIYFVLLNKYG